MMPDALQKILNAHDAEACLAYFEHATEAQRRKLAKPAAEHLRALTADGLDRFLSLTWYTEDDLKRLFNHGHSPDPQAIRTAQIAVLATAALGRLKALGWRALPPPDDAIRVLKARQPPWVTEWAEAILSGSGAFRNSSALGWRFVRRFIREGFCDRLHGPRYINAMIQGLLTFQPGESVYQALLDDPTLLDAEVWEIFETEPEPGNLGTLPTDRWVQEHHRWDLALVRLANEGRISRPRLLDASLDGLERDFHEVRGRWFALVHESLEPTLDERAERAGRYLGLLASHNASTVTFALRALKILDAKHRLDPGSVLDSVGPALLARTKGTVLAALKLIDRAAARDPSQRSKASRIAAEALGHEAPAVHEQVINLLERFGDPSEPDLHGFLVGRIELVAPSQKTRLAEWLGLNSEVVEPGVPAGSADFRAFEERISALDPQIAERAGVIEARRVLSEGGGSVPAIVLDEMDLHRLDPDRAIEPVEDLHDLIRLFLLVLEDPDRTDDAERVLDGVSRLCDQRPDDFEERTGPLRKRAEEGISTHLEFRQPLVSVALAWTCGRYPRINIPERPPSLARFLGRRILEITRRVAEHHAAPLLSAPTHEGAWIDPRALVERVQECEHRSLKMDRLDGVLALLRLAPDRAARVEALKAAEGLKGPFSAALRHALGGDVDEVGPDAQIWVAAARARAPLEDDERVEARHPGLGPDAGWAAQCSLRPGPHGVFLGQWHRRPSLIDCHPPLPQEVGDDLPSVLFHVHEGNFLLYKSRRVATIWPLGRDTFFASGVDELVGTECSPSMSTYYRPFLEVLLDPDVPIRAMARFVLVGGLSSNRPELQGLAVDAAIASIDDGRLDGPGLGKAAGHLLREGLAKRTRVAKALAEVARVSPLHAREVALALQHALSGVSEAFRDLHHLLELLKELLVETGAPFSVSEAAAALQALKVEGKTGRLIREILNIRNNENAIHLIISAERVLQGRLERAERWMRLAGQPRHQVIE